MEYVLVHWQSQSSNFLDLRSMSQNVHATNMDQNN